jgi:F0F1-type ATP synthase assembly protein I
MPFIRPIPKTKSRIRPAARALATLVEAEKMMQIAILLPSAAFIGWLGGAWLDSVLHQSWIAVLGILFGGVSGLVYVVRLAARAGKKAAKVAAESEKGSEKP